MSKHADRYEGMSRFAPAVPAAGGFLAVLVGIFLLLNLNTFGIFLIILGVVGVVTGIVLANVSLGDDE